MNTEFVKGILNWYWEHGSKRVEKYSLPLSGWVRCFYEVREGLDAADISAKDEKPACAVWGPSQTGKSTLVSGYFDRFSIKERNEADDGKNSALYWPGGQPCYFMLPAEYLSDPPPWAKTLNPFRLGKDASACLSRFSLGSLTPQKGRYHVQSPQFPIELKLLNQAELLHVMGRGYDTECLGPTPTGSATLWTIDEFADRVGAAKKKGAPGNKGIDRQAFEMLIDVCNVFDSMVFAELIRYQPLMKEGAENWNSMLAGLLDDPKFASSPELVEALAAEVLWDGAEPLTLAYRKLKKSLEKFRTMWGNRTVHCDLQVAALLLDMDSVLVAFDGPPPEAGKQSRDRQIAEQIPRMRYKIEADRVFIGLSPSLPYELSLSAEDYGHLQSLVLEMIIPVNPEYLEETNFKKFLDTADLLDFPGVGNDSNAKYTKIDLGFGNAQLPGDVPTDVPPSSRFPKYDPRLFFTRILKRGKTSTIVSLYARKLKLDAFNIFLALDKNPPAKPSELSEGVNTWWKCAVPKYFKGGRVGKSPMPLNLVLLWWKGFIDEANPTIGNYMAKPKWIYDPLGEISNPTISNFFALNYYRIPGRGGPILDPTKLNPDSFFVRGITAESEFKRVFGEGDKSGFRSFMSMLDDKHTGGAEFYFNELVRQLQTPTLSRGQMLKEVIDGMRERTKALLSAKDLFPEPEERDIRVENLEEMQSTIIGIIEKSNEQAVSQINHLMREYLNVDYRVLNPVPNHSHEVTGDYIRAQYATWIMRQWARVESWRKTGRSSKPNWGLLGLDNRERFCGWLEAVTASLEPDLVATASWLRTLVDYNSDRGGADQVSDLRRILSIRMGNLLVYSKSGLPGYDASPDEEANFAPPLGANLGKACASYQVFLQPFLEMQLPGLIRLEGAQMMKRQEQPGDQELRKLCLDHDCLPASAAVPANT